MFSNLFKKEKSRVFLDSIVVAPRSELKKIDEWDVFKHSDFESDLKMKLIEIFELPHITKRTESHTSDLALDVVVIDFQGGFVGAVEGELFVPLIWHPKVHVKSRLYYIDSKKTKASFSAIAKVPWKTVFSRYFTLAGLFQFRPLFGKEDMEILLFQACHSLLSKMVKAV